MTQEDSYNSQRVSIHRGVVGWLGLGWLELSQLTTQQDNIVLRVGLGRVGPEITPTTPYQTVSRPAWDLSYVGFLQ